ncbi:MAG: arginine--tRNA ligase [Clostridiales Family XIII bacterium]|jgi:arginyl-tRNA synthetase|nr:arginine--tRNA ligase [Clostridiales Family XIII bacterium]
MRNFKKEIAAAAAALPEIAAAGLTAEDMEALVEVPADSALGDYAFPCFRLAKAFRKSPQQIAAELAEGGALAAASDAIGRVEAVNAYVNFFLRREAVVLDAVCSAVAAGASFGRSETGAGRKVVVEFSSPNIAKPFHIGHIRSTVIGNSIDHIYRHLGYDTVRVNHLGDYGTQFGKMIVAYRRWGDRAAVEGEPIKTLLSYYTRFHEEAEGDPSLEDEAREVFAKLEQGSEEELALWQWFREESLKEFGRVYDMLGIAFDSYAGESFYSDKMQRIVDELKGRGLLEASDGAQIVDLSAQDMPPALIQKKDGSTLYITRDLAAAVYRKEHYGFYKNLYIVASQQNLHFRQLIGMLGLLGYDWAEDCVHIPFGLVSLEDGTMSTREGRVVFLEDVLRGAVERTRQIVVEKGVNTDDIDGIARQVGIGAVIFNELSAGRIKDYVFSWDKVLTFDGETGPYVQYVYARAASVLRKAQALGDADPAEALSAGAVPEAGFIMGDAAFALAKLIHAFPDSVLAAGEKYEPSIVARHIVDTAQAFNRFYHDETVLVEDAAERAAKLALVCAAKETIAVGLGLLGMEAPERM